jgi:hypothetical protein
MQFKKKNVAVTVALMAATSSCGKKGGIFGKEESKAAATSTVPASVSDLALSSALKIEIPDKMATASGGTTSLALNSFSLAGTKSREACHTMEETGRILEQLTEISSMFCHFEAESGNLKFGTKYNITMAAGGGGGGGGGGEGGAPPPAPLTAVDADKMQLWIDNRDAEYLHVYMCQKGKLAQHIKVSTASAAGKTKGSMTAAFDMGANKGGVNLDFDLTTPGTKLVKASMQFTMTGAVSGSFSNFADISLLDTGVSTVKMSKSGTFMGNTHADRSMLLFNGTYGQVVFEASDFSTVSTYGADGNTVADSLATADITVPVADLPAALGTDFAPTAPDGWDCVADTELKIDGATGAAHQACETDRSPKFSDCDGGGFARGEHKDVPDKAPSNRPEGMSEPSEKKPGE